MIEHVVTKRDGRQFTFLLDDEDAHLALLRWTVAVKEGRPYGYRKNRKGATYLHHAVIRDQVPKGLVCDHRNGNPLDNRRSNLRMVPDGHNVQNSKQFSTNTSGYRGVSWNKNAESWSAAIHFQNRKYHLGLFDDIGEAARAYDRAAIGFFGPGAMTNLRAA